LTELSGSPFTATARPFEVATSNPHPTPQNRQGVLLHLISSDKESDAFQFEKAISGYKPEVAVNAEAAADFLKNFLRLIFPIYSFLGFA
jgi:hypothetical protein